MNLLDRIWKHVRRGGPDECWHWLGCKSEDGHGLVRVNGRTRKVHRVIYELITGKTLPPDVVVRHTCSSADCCNPSHLAEGTHADNVADRVAAGRSACGERNGRARLTWAGVDMIRDMAQAGDTPGHLAKLFGCDPANIRRIVAGVIWKTEARSSAFAVRT